MHAEFQINSHQTQTHWYTLNILLMEQACQRELKLNLETQPQQKSNTKDMSLDYYTENRIA